LGARTTDDSSASSTGTTPTLGYPLEFLSAIHRSRQHPPRCLTTRPASSPSGLPDTLAESQLAAVMTSRHALLRSHDARRSPATPPPPRPDRSSTHLRYPHLLPHFVARLS